MYKLRDEATASKILSKIKAMDVDYRFMHVCGTHQDTMVRFGLDTMLRDVGVEIKQGPGCPVCVTTSKEIADAITMARSGITICAFGDMMRVPTTIGTLNDAKADGCDVRIVYSIEDAVRMAREQDKPLVFVSVGFETTAPSTAVPLQHELPENFSIYSCHRICPPILEAIFTMGETKVQGLIDPGHVAVITGYSIFEPLAKDWNMPQVISGFEPLDMLMSVYMLCKQVKEGRAEVENEYTRLVKPEGNLKARKLIEDTFVPVDRAWRGFPVIKKSALALKDRYAYCDATKVHEDILAKTPEVEPEAKGCRCGDVLRGLIDSEQCPMFGKACKPMSPMGPCMVSQEGGCNIAFRFSGKRV
ncbi:MAG: hydrogenase formation protein HypD [Candidatus Methanomethylophilaceae archaeon]|nr:hydrogenase formation protein HypD [Candidatus Methanomethylophilaceae archaeon]